MHIAIDSRLYGLKHAGIGRYVQNLVANLALIDHTNHYTLLVTATQDIDPLPHNFTTVTAPIRHYTFAEQTEFLSVLNSFHFDLVHFPHFNVPLMYHRPYVVTIHDLLWHKKIGLSATTLNPTTYFLKYFGYRIVIKNAINRAQVVITPSAVIKKSIIKTFATNPDKIAVSYEAPDPIYSKTVSTQTLEKYHLTKPFIIYTGSLYPHKNVNTLINSLHQLPNLTLVISSARNIFYTHTKDFVHAQGLDKQVKFLGYVPDSELVSLYHHALALVQPSLSEGFGLTGLEAMSAGLPVICSQHPVLEEIYANAALFVDTNSVSALAASISRLQTDTKLSTKLTKLGKIQAAKYSWAKMAQQTLNVYQQVLHY